jgi:type IV fimbrial biogenesis protein FimT
MRAGFSLLEMLIALSVSAILIVLGAPSFRDWINNNQIRSAATALNASVQLARAEAVRRNATVFFTLTDSATNSCTQSLSGGNFVVSLANPDNRCGDAIGAAPAQLIQVRPASETSKAVITSNQTQISFNGFGRANVAANICVGIAADSGACIGTANEHRLQVTINAGGQIRMCNPALSSNDPQGC